MQNSHPALRYNCGAAFSVFDEADAERLIVVQEVERTYRGQNPANEIIPCIREALAREHDLAAREIVLIRTGSLPKTTSGKVQRRLTRQRFLEGSLVVKI